MLLSTFVVWLFVLNISAVKESYSCTVFSMAAAVAGETFSLKCVPNSKSYVSEWNRDDDDVNGTVPIYQSAVYNDMGQLTQNRSFADGYSLDISGYPNMTLTLNKSVIARAGYYSCRCTKTNAAGFSDVGGIQVSVVEFVQFFFNGSSLSITEAVQLNCSVSFRGKANSSLQILDMNSGMLAKREEVASSITMQRYSLTYVIPVGDTIKNNYSCIFNLLNDSLQTIPYSKTLKTAVQFSVRNVSITPESAINCQENGTCLSEMKINCNAHSSPDPAYYWTVYYNGSVFNSSGSYYETSKIGVQTIQCTAYNVIGEKTYNYSANFTTNVIAHRYIPPDESTSAGAESKIPLIVGLVVGLGGGLIIILVIVVVVLWKRKKRNGMKSDNGAQQMEVSNGAGKTGNGKATSGGPMPDVMPTQQKTRGSDETVLVENDIYARDSKAAPGHTNHIHTFDGGYSSLDDLDKK